MISPERFQRGLAAVVGVLATSRWLYGTFTDPDPRAGALPVIVLRVVVCGWLLFMFARRAISRKMTAFAWAVFALWFVDGIWRAKTGEGVMVGAICVALVLVGWGVENRLERAAAVADGIAGRS